MTSASTRSPVTTSWTARWRSGTSRRPRSHTSTRRSAPPARDCIVQPINGVGSQGDHLLLTPNTEWGRIIYSVTYSADNTAWLQACNMFSQAINAGTGRFNLLVIDKG